VAIAVRDHRVEDLDEAVEPDAPRVRVGDAPDFVVRAEKERDDRADVRAALERALDEAERFERPGLPVSGEDVLAAGVAPGPAVGRLLGAVEDWWVEHDFAPDRAACLARLAELTEPDQGAEP
ncbi:MAG: hypothetical protein R3349_11470, partial [Geminicoccaceae bacterium]|nr:hypothetical protein [Geminicoccaceae bacterium]